MKKLLAAMLLCSGCIDVQNELNFESGHDRGVPEPGAERWGRDVPWAAEDFEPKLDIPSFVEALSCSALDVLFIIDNSGSMDNDQDKLRDAVPSFIDQLQLLGLGLEGGLHLGVVTTDSFTQNDSDCDGLGHLVTRVGSGECGPYADGYRFMTQNDDLEESFSCASNVGAMGAGDERAIDAMLLALGAWNNRPGGCNDGFSRSTFPAEEQGGIRAGLVVVILTDEDDDAGSAEDPTDWVDHLEFLREGTLDDAAVILIGGIEDTPDCNPEYPLRLILFTERVPHGYVGSICDENYDQIFSESIEIIRESCGLSAEPVE